MCAASRSTIARCGALRRATPIVSHRCATYDMEVRSARIIHGTAVAEWTPVSRASRERRAQRRHRARLARAAGTSRKPIKLSAAIERIIEPYVDEDLAIDMHRSLIVACAAAWNLSVIAHEANRDPSKAGDVLEQAWADVDRAGATVVVEELKRRKTLLFPDDRRFIVNASLQPLSDGGWYLNVASTLLDEQQKEVPPPMLMGPRAGIRDVDAPPSPNGDPLQQSRTAATKPG